MWAHLLAARVSGAIGVLVVAARGILDILEISLDMVKVIQGLEGGLLVPENVALDEPRQPGAGLVPPEATQGHGKDVVEFFERALLGLRHEEEDHDQGAHVEARVEAECARRGQGRQHAREGDGQNSGPEEARRHGPAHADFSVRQGEDFGRVRERHGSLAGGVEGREDVDEQGDEGEVGGVFFGDVETESAGEQRPSHLGEGEQQERPTAKGVDSEERRPGKHEVNQTESERGQKGFLLRSTSGSEDSGGVEGLKKWLVSDELTSGTRDRDSIQLTIMLIPHIC